MEGKTGGGNRGSREFPPSLRELLSRRTGNRCHFCGYKIHRNAELAHIVSCSQSARRRGTTNKQYKIKYLRSIKNALLLHSKCHKKIDSNNGLRKFSKSFLEKLRITPIRKNQLTGRYKPRRFSANYP